MEPYGRGHWPEAKLTLPDVQPPSRKTANTVRSIPSSPPRSQPDTSALAGPSEEKDQVEGSVRRKGAFFRTGSESEGESENDEPLQPVQSASKRNHLSEEDIEDNPDNAYVVTKLKITSLQRKLGVVAGKGGKRGGKTKSKPLVGKKDKTAEDIELEELEALLKRSQSQVASRRIDAC